MSTEADLIPITREAWTQIVLQWPGDKFPHPSYLGLRVVDGVVPVENWRCFHCNEVFTDEDQARLHFGSSEVSQPACQIDTKRLRELELELERYRAEDTDLHREIHRLHADHHTALQRSEEAGYARGLRDASQEGEEHG